FPPEAETVAGEPTGVVAESQIQVAQIAFDVVEAVRIDHAERGAGKIVVQSFLGLLRVEPALPEQKPQVGVHRCSCRYPPSPRGGPALQETLKVATFAIPQSHSVDCKAERVRPGRCGNDTPIVPSASWRRSKTVTR